MTIRGRLYICLVLLASVASSGTAGFHFIEGWTWFDGFYMTLTTMTTIGYGEIHPLSRAGRIFNSFLIVFAVFSGGFTIATFSQAFLQFEFGKAFGRRRMERELAKLSDHYIIAERAVSAEPLRANCAPAVKPWFSSKRIPSAQNGRRAKRFPSCLATPPARNA